jgi:ribosomal protein L29
MKIDEIRKLKINELIEKKSSNNAEYRKLKFALKSGEITAENINRAREIKKENALISTVINEIKLTSDVE